MQIQPLTHSDILSRVETNRIKFIDLQFTDVVGVVKNVTIPVAQLPAAIDPGIWFDGSSIEGFARVAESDMYLVPDLSTFAVLPWLSGDEATARLICDVYTPNGQPFLGDPRGVLARVLADADKMGFLFQTGPELEFFLLRPNADGSIIPPVPQDGGGYFDVPTDMASGFRRKMVSMLAAFGMEVEAMHHEVATGQHEIDFRYSDGLHTADNAVTFRVALKILAQQHGLYATFLPSPFAGLPGAGCTFTRVSRTRPTAPTPSPIRAIHMACPRSPSILSPGSSPTRAACAPSSRRWSIRISGWLPGTKPRCT